MAELTGSLIAAVVIFNVGKFIYTNQKFTFGLSEAKGGVQVSLSNDSKFISYREKDIHFRIYIPATLFERILKLEVEHDSQWKTLLPDNYKDKVVEKTIKSDKYYLFAYDLQRNLYSESKVALVNLIGDFKDLENQKFFMSLSSSKGPYPSWCYTHSGNAVSKVENGLLPHVWFKLTKSNTAKKLKVKIDFLWYDFWVGWFWDRDKKVLYICPFPMLVVKIWRE